MQKTQHLQVNELNLNLTYKKTIVWKQNIKDLWKYFIHVIKEEICIKMKNMLLCEKGLMLTRKEEFMWEE